jgi:hypothetical protein
MVFEGRMIFTSDETGPVDWRGSVFADQPSGQCSIVTKERRPHRRDPGSGDRRREFSISLGLR